MSSCELNVFLKALTQKPSAYESGHYAFKLCTVGTCSKHYVLLLFTLEAALLSSLILLLGSKSPGTVTFRGKS